MNAKTFIDDFTNQVIRYLDDVEKRKQRNRKRPIETDDGLWCDGCDTYRGETIRCMECKVWNCVYCTTWCEECGCTVCCDESKYCDECERNLCAVCNCECVCNKSKP